jgi:signal transduction histidine kinase
MALLEPELHALLLAVWPPAFAAIATYYVVQLRRKSGSSSAEAERMSYLTQEMMYRADRAAAESRSMLPAIVQSSLEDLSSQLNRTVEMSVRRNITAQRPVSPAISVRKLATERRNAERRLIRELSHQVNTPISQMEASLLLIRREYSGSLPAMDERLARIQTGLEMVKSTFLAFREGITGVRGASAWSPESLPNSLRSAFEMYQTSAEKHLQFVCELPEELEGISKNLLFALILPLLENAVDAASAGSEVRIGFSLSDTRYTLSVVNSEVESLPFDEIYEDGFTTKAEHSGIGLSVVKDLLASQPDSTIEHNFSGRTVVFSISLRRPELEAH